MNETMRVIQSLRSTHWTFNDKVVSREDIETIIAHSLRASNNNDRMDLSVVVVEDPALLNELTGGESDNKAVPTLVYAIDHARQIACAKAMGYPDYAPGNRLYHFLFGMYDVCAAAQTAVIAAKSMGIDALITNFAHRHAPGETAKRLNMPEEYCFPVIMVALGYSDKPACEVTPPLSPDLSIHYGRYTPPSEEKIKRMIDDVDRAYPAQINESHPHALDWFYHDWWGPEWYSEETYRALADAFIKSKLLREPGVCQPLT